jgi:hypothetical protein
VPGRSQSTTAVASTSREFRSFGAIDDNPGGRCPSVRPPVRPSVRPSGFPMATPRRRRTSTMTAATLPRSRADHPGRSVGRPSLVPFGRRLSVAVMTRALPGYATRLARHGISVQLTCAGGTNDADADAGAPTSTLVVRGRVVSLRPPCILFRSLSLSSFLSHEQPRNHPPSLQLSFSSQPPRKQVRGSSVRPPCSGQQW